MSVFAARAVLVGVGLHDVESAKRIRDEILSKVSFVLPRHQGLDVRALLQQDLLLLHALCLDGDVMELDRVEGAVTTVATRCWRIHVGLLMDILRRMPAVADESVAMVNHVAMPCLGTVAELCLGGGVFPAFGEEGTSEQQDSAVTGRAAASVSDDELFRVSGGRVEDVVLCEVLRASADSAVAGGGRGGGGGGGGVEWITPAQARSAQQGPTLGGQQMPASAGSRASGESWGAGDTAGPSRFWARSLPDHWLLGLMANRQSPALRRFAGVVLSALAVTKGPGMSKEVAEVAAHLLGVVGAEGSEAAGMQVYIYIAYWLLCGNLIFRFFGVHIRVHTYAVFVLTATL